MLGGVQGLNMSFQYGGTQCPPPTKKCIKDKKCIGVYYKKCKPQWMPMTSLGAVG